MAQGQNTKVSSENEKGTDEDEDSSRKYKSNLEVKETSEYKNMISDQLYNIPKKTHSEKKQVTRYSFIVLSFLQVSSSEGLEIHESRANPPTLQK